MKFGVRARFLLLVLLAAFSARAEERVLQLDSGETLKYTIVSGTQASARPIAERMLRYLAAGDIEQAALLSNAPRRRFDVLRDYRERVGELELRRVFSQYLFPENRVVAEIAMGPRRLIIWDLGEAGHRLAGQYYVEIEGKFLMDDVPGEERSQLQKILQAYRAGNVEKPGRTTISPGQKD